VPDLHKVAKRADATSQIGIYIAQGWGKQVRLLRGLSATAMLDSSADGGLDADFQAVCTVVETLASGCLTTTFVWVQHIGAVLAAVTSENDVIARQETVSRARYHRA
jgi:hypothetical protein